MAGAPKKGGFSLSKIYEWITKKFEDFGLTDFMAFLAPGLVIVGGFRDPATFFQMGAFFLALLPLVLPVFLYKEWWHVWMEYIHEDKYWNGYEYTLLEVRLPEEITQSPYAMELVIRSMYDVGGIDTPIDEFWKGNMKPWYSLEIISTEGQVRFYIWGRKGFKNFIESQIYAHYPSVQVYEVEDYTLKVPFNAYDPNGEYDIWGIEQRLQKPDPYPIATYVSTDQSKPDLKEEFKHDQLASLLEFFSIMKPGEHAWMQIIIRGHTVCPWAPGHPMPIQDWVDLERNKILASTITESDGKPNFSRLSEGDRAALKAMDLKPHKQVWDAGIRMVYMFKKGDPALGKQKAGFPTVMRAYEHGSGGLGLNGFKPIFVIGPFNYPWQDYFGVRQRYLKQQLYDGYVSRQYFFAPYDRKWIALNVEELASVYHFPGKVAATPTLARMPSKRGDAPSNLPTGA
jgi:hypothetical protein